MTTEETTTQGVPAKAIVFVVLVFLALVVVLLTASGEGKSEEGEPARPTLSGIEPAGDGQVVDVTAGLPLSLRELENLVRGRISLLRAGGTNERRATAVELANMANEPDGREDVLRLRAPLQAELREALLNGLSDRDPLVVRSCRRGLAGLWRMNADPRVSTELEAGLAAYEQEDFNGALAAFAEAEKLGGSAVPDLHRMKAECYLAGSPPDAESAVKECRLALASEPKHFEALYVLALALVEQGHLPEAEQALEGALAICGSFPEALELRAELAAARDAE